MSVSLYHWMEFTSITLNGWYLYFCGTNDNEKSHMLKCELNYKQAVVLVDSGWR